MEKERLTAYDKFILQQKQKVAEVKEETTEQYEEMPGEYKLYLEQQLRRVEPSDAKVMTMDEFFGGTDEKKEEMFKMLSGEKTENKSNSILRNIKFKKSGRILLGLYVIIMLALALIVIVKTTTAGPDVSADAAEKLSESEKLSQIERMDVEDETTDDDNWFDRFCDSLKK